ncbi:hypothetical protein N8989_01445 [Gammaproteobacteria bacterium]|nr:hypothetical protein [Gammaproteobacteria bacterium]
MRNLIKKILFWYRFGPQKKIYKSQISSNVRLGKYTSITESKISGPITLGDYTSIADSTQILAKFDEISIGARVSIAPNVLIQNYTHNLNHRITNNNAFEAKYGRSKLMSIIKETSKPIVIEDDVWIGINCVILPGINIGRGSVIAANSVVNKNIGSFEIWGGNPAKYLRSRSFID